MVRGYLTVPIRETSQQILYDGVDSGKISPKSLDTASRNKVIDEARFSFLPKSRLAEMLETNRSRAHDLVTSYKRELSEVELFDDTDPTLIAQDILDLRDRCINLALSQRAPKVAWSIAKETVGVLQDLGIVEKVPEKIQLVEQVFQVDFAEDGVINVAEVELVQDENGVYTEQGSDKKLPAPDAEMVLVLGDGD